MTDTEFHKLFQRWAIDTIIPYKVQVKERCDSLDALHATITKLALSEHDRRKECPQLWTFVNPKLSTALVLHTRWRSNAEKSVIYAALRHMLQATPEIARYGYCGESFALPEGHPDAVNPYREYDSLSVHPDRYEQLLVMSFEREPQRQKVDIYAWPANQPKRIKHDPRYSTDDPGFDIVGEAWNLFGSVTKH